MISSFILHIGDTRAYLFRQNNLKRLTHDQTKTVAQALADSGAISADEASTHRLRHSLTALVNLALQKGGEENITVVPARYSIPSTA